MNLTNNEKKFLEILIDNARITDVEISKRIKISAQAVGKIRKKLEKEKLIESYEVNLNLEKMGINILALFRVNFSPRFWEKYNEEDVAKTVNNSNHIICSGRLINAEESLFSLAGFRNQDELEAYLRESMSKFKDFSTYKRIDIFSSKSLLKMSKSSLYKEILSQKTPKLEIDS
jgi:Lrp/AsnC family transcriptional regulator, leucine-responsive regulatory protein